CTPSVLQFVRHVAFTSVVGYRHFTIAAAASDMKRLTGEARRVEIPRAAPGAKIVADDAIPSRDRLLRDPPGAPAGFPGDGQEGIPHIDGGDAGTPRSRRGCGARQADQRGVYGARRPR